MSISPIINIDELSKIYKNEHLVIVEAGSGGSTKENYKQRHLDGAFYVDLNDDLAEIPENAANGGRHPLPSLEKFAKTLQNIGIDESSHIIIYDDKNASNAAARFWWMLKSVGLEKVQVLNGGFQQAEIFGFPINSEIPEGKKVNLLQLEQWKFPLIHINEIEKISQNPEFMIIDVRENERYNGEKEPIDLIAGHIPGAKNLPFKNNLEENGLFKSPEILKKYFLDFLSSIPSENVAVHCGSGVTACHTLLAMDYAGLEIPKLYIGSWSEWSRNEKPIEKNI